MLSTNRQTNATENITSFCQGGKNLYHPTCRRMQDDVTKWKPMKMGVVSHMTLGKVIQAGLVLIPAPVVMCFDSVMDNWT